MDVSIEQLLVIIGELEVQRRILLEEIKRLQPVEDEE